MTLNIFIFFEHAFGPVQISSARIEQFPRRRHHEYNLKEKTTKGGFVYVEVQKGMYG